MFTTQENVSETLLPQESRKVKGSWKYAFLFLGTILLCIGAHNLVSEEEPLSSVARSSSKSFTFYKDKGERIGSWSACGPKGVCGNYGSIDPHTSGARWSPPATNMGGKILLTQAPTAGMHGTPKYKFFDPTLTWRVSEAGEKGVVTVIGVDKHSYGLSKEALAALISVADVRQSAKWCLVLDAILPKGMTISPLAFDPSAEDILEMRAEQKKMPPTARTIQIKFDHLHMQQVVTPEMTFADVLAKHHGSGIGDGLHFTLGNGRTHETKHVTYGEVKNQKVLSYPNFPVDFITGLDSW